MQPTLTTSGRNFATSESDSNRAFQARLQQLNIDSSHKRYGTTVLDDDSDVGVHPIISSIVQSVQNSPTLSGVLLSVMEIMDMLPTPPDAAEALAAIGHRIYRAFESLSHEDEDSFSSALVNESQRFGLWAKNVGLYNLGLTSLDHKFRDAPVVILADGFKVQRDLDRQKPRRELAVERSHSPGKISDQATTIDRDYDEGEGSDESSEDEETLMSYQQDSISIIVLENAKLIIDRLYKLSFKIRTLPKSTGTEDEVSMEGTDSKAANEECSYLDSGVHSSVVADEKAYDSFSSGEESIVESTATSESRDTGATLDTGTSGQSQGKGSFLSTPPRSLRPPPPVPGSPGMGGLAEGSGHTSTNPSGPPLFYPQQPYASRYQDTHGYQTRRPDQLNTDFYKTQRSPDIENFPSPPSPSEYPCLHPNCGHISSRAQDLKSHMTVHFPPEELLDCKYEWCGRTGKKVGIRRQAKQGGTTPMLHIIVNSRRRENHGPPAQLHNESSDEGIFGDEL
ncbi:MAG: hypothetical protein ASARMPREDX12_006280 [Alectoria sarmentosa]|nr:MAG: hypothetical protein ASARMPREDX12_006280 [Alectoria sarmentosa]